MMANVCTDSVHPPAAPQLPHPGQTARTARPAARTRAGFARSPVRSREDLVLSPLKIPSHPQHLQQHQAFPPVRVFLCITSILRHAAFWHCCGLSTTVPLKVCRPSFKTAPANARTAVTHQDTVGFEAAGLGASPRCRPLGSCSPPVPSSRNVTGTRHTAQGQGQAGAERDARGEQPGGD